MVEVRGREREKFIYSFCQFELAATTHIARI